MKTVYCIGELLIDFVAEKQGNDLSKASEFTKKPGGAPANVACAIARLGGNSSFIGAVGDDPFGSYLLQVMADNGVAVSLAQRSETFTTLAFVSLAEDGERDFVFSRGADRELIYNPLVKNDFGGNMVHFGAATALLGGSLEEAYAQYFNEAIAQGSFISFDPNFRGDLWTGKEKMFIKKCMPYIEKSHLCKFSLEEARLLSGKADIQECCSFLHHLGTAIIAITLGEKGTFISMENLRRTVPSIPVKCVDTTGAGDAFIGCLLRQIAALADAHEILERGDLLIKMVEHANRAGAITTTGFGAIPSLPDHNQVFGA